MRILLIHQYFLEDNEGGGSRWNDMSRMWSAAGNEITVLAGMGHYMDGQTGKSRRRYFERYTNADGVRVIRCFVPENYNSNFRARLLAYFSFTIFSVLGGLSYAREKYDVVIVSSPPLFVGLTALILSWIKGIPFVFEVRDLWPDSAIETRVLKNKVLIKLALGLEKYLYRKAARITVLTPAFSDELIKRKHVDPQKLILVPNGADFELAGEVLAGMNIQDFRKQHELEDKFVIAYVGAHGIANNLMQMLETAEILREENVCFLLIGDGMEKEKLIRYAEQRNLNNVKFIRRLSKREVLRYILAADMGASVLQKADIFKTVYSNKTFDYFSCGKPVLMAIDGLSRKLVEEAGAGMFVMPENPVDFADKIRIYLNDRLLLEKHGQNGYIYARTHFDRIILSKRYLGEMEKMVMNQ